MKESRKVILPVAGQVQHGEQLMENNKKKVVDYGYFIAKIRKNNMKQYLDKFNEIIRGSSNIDIKFVNNDPLSIRMERSNQSGAVCYCLENESIGKQINKGQWQDIECNSNCSYLQKDEKGKSACNRIAWLKFIIPQIATDRIWLMKITGQKSINNLKGYILLQKAQGTLLSGTYSMFLEQEEQTNRLGKKYNNYILDIFKREETSLNILTSQQKQETLQELTPKEVKQDNTNEDKKETINTKDVTTQEQESKSKQTKATTSKTTTSKKSTSKTNTDISKTNSNTPKTDSSTSKVKASDKQQTNDKKSVTGSSNFDTSDEVDTNWNNYYILNEVYNKIIFDAEGNEKKYLAGEFFDINDKKVEILIRPENESELLDCGESSIIIMETKAAMGNLFAMSFKIYKKNKKVA